MFDHRQSLYGVQSRRLHQPLFCTYELAFHELQSLEQLLVLDEECRQSIKQPFKHLRATLIEKFSDLLIKQQLPLICTYYTYISTSPNLNISVTTMSIPSTVVTG